MARAISSGPRSRSSSASAASAANSALSTLMAPVSGVDDPLPAPGELGMAGAQHNVGGVGVVDGDRRDAGLLQEPRAPWVVGVDHAAQRVARREQHRLRLEVLLHRPVVVEVVVAEVREDRDVEVDALDP